MNPALPLYRICTKESIYLAPLSRLGAQVSTYDDYLQRTCWMCCREDLEYFDRWTTCGHVFCSGCSNALFEVRMPCPLCLRFSTTVKRCPFFFDLPRTVADPTSIEERNDSPIPAAGHCIADGTVPYRLLCSLTTVLYHIARRGPRYGSLFAKYNRVIDVRGRSEEETCCVCFRGFGLYQSMKTMYVPCGHASVCIDCTFSIDRTASALRCPMCRSSVDVVLYLGIRQNSQRNGVGRIVRPFRGQEKQPRIRRRRHRRLFGASRDVSCPYGTGRETRHYASD